MVWSLRHHITHRKAHALQDWVPPFPSVEVSNRAFEVGLAQPCFQSVFVDRDARTGCEDDALHDAVAVPVLFPTVGWLLHCWHCGKDACYVGDFVFVCGVEKRTWVFDYFDDVHEGGFGGDGVVGEEVTAIFVGWLFEGFVEEAGTEGDEVVAVVAVAVVCC